MSGTLAAADIESPFKLFFDKQVSLDSGNGMFLSRQPEGANDIGNGAEQLVDGLGFSQQHVLHAKKSRVFALTARRSPNLVD